jgi:putative ABC transport system permease protein
MTSERWFRRLLRLLPFDFRADYGDEMTRVFHAERSAAVGRAGLLRVWFTNLSALAAIGPREHVAQLGQDVRYALRSMRGNAAFVAAAILTLALGIGANTAVFSIVEAVLLRPLPYAEPETLVAVWNRWTGSPVAALSNPEYLDYAEQSQSMTIAASAAANVNVGAEGGDPERVPAAFVTSNAYDVLGVAPRLGRSFRADEDVDGAPRVAILSDGFWRRRFAANPGVVGSMISVDGRPTQVVGVLRAGVVLPFEIGGATAVDVVLPLTLDRAAARNRRGGHYLFGFARLRTGAGTSRPAEAIASASAEMDAILARLARQYPDQHDQGDFGIVVRSLREDRLGDARPVLWILLGAVSLVLLIACANVASLVLARGASRRQEMEVRTALGANRFRIIRQLLTESCVLSSAGAAAGLVVAWFSQSAIVSIGASALPRLADVRMSPAVLAFTALLASGTGVVFGLIPALHVSRSRAGADLKTGSRGATDRSRQVLVIGQTAIAVVLLVAAGLLVKSFVRLTRVPLGIETDRVLTTRIALPDARYPDRASITAFFGELLSRVRALPGVRGAGAASGLPLAVFSGDWGFDIEGRSRVNGRRPGAADWFVVTSGYFEALAVPLRRGRLPADSDTSAAPPVVFVNEATARVLFPSTDPIGKRIRLSNTTGAEQPWRTIAGIVADVRHRGLDTPPRTEIFIPDQQFLHFSAGVQARAMSLVIKTAGDPQASVAAVRATLRALDPEVPAAQVRNMSTIVSMSVADRRLNMWLVGAFGGLALVLAATGLYGVMAYTVSQRTREVGVRIALGATRGSVLSLVVGRALGLVVAGLAIGVGLSLLVTGSLARLLFDVGPRDLTTHVVALAVLLLTAVAASYFPARRAARVDPVMALRAE